MIFQIHCAQDFCETPSPFCSTFALKGKIFHIDSNEGAILSSIFPQPIRNLPEVSIPYSGVKGYLVQGENEQIVFMEFEKDTEVPEHSHESQWEIVLDGKVDYWEDGKKHTYNKGDKFFVQSGKKHSAYVHAGYSCIMFFNQKDRYKKKS